MTTAPWSQKPDVKRARFSGMLCQLAGCDGVLQKTDGGIATRAICRPIGNTHGRPRAMGIRVPGGDDEPL